MFIFLSLGFQSCIPPVSAANSKALQQQTEVSSTRIVSTQPLQPEQPVTATPLPTSPPPKRPIYIVDPKDQGVLSNIFMVDPDTQRIVWTIQTRFLPEVVLSPDNQRLYVADSYRAQVTRGAQQDALSIFDAHNGSLLVDDIPIQGRLLYKAWPLTRDSFMFISDDGQQLLIEKYGDPDIHQLRLAVLSTTQFELMHEGLLPPCDHRIVAFSDRWICIHNTTLFELNPLVQSGGKKALLTIPGFSVVSVIFDAQLNRLYTVDANATVNVIDVKNFTVLETKRFEISEGWRFARNIALAPDSKRIYISLFSNANQSNIFIDAVAVYDTANWKPIARFNFASPNYHFALSASGDHLYAISPDTRSLAIYDTESFQQIARMNDLGGMPSLILVPRATH